MGMKVEQAMITTIIPTYRRPALLRRAVLSALVQGGSAIRVAVFDNASGDSTRAVIAELATKDDRVVYHCHEKNIGALANFQFGLEQVTTPYFSFLSDDDVLLPGFYDKALADMEGCPRAAFWCGVTISMNPDGTFVSARVADWPNEGLFFPPDGILQMIKGSMPCWTAAIFRKSMMDLNGPLNKDLQGPSDIEYMLRAAARYPFIASKQAAAIFLLNPESFSETSPLKCFWPGWKDMMRTVSVAGKFDEASQLAIWAGIRANARRMLFRRGAAALAKKSYSFSGEAASILRSELDDRSRASILSGLTRLCSKSSAAQTAYSRCYRSLEEMIIRSRVSQRSEYGRLSKYL